MPQGFPRAGLPLVNGSVTLQSTQYADPTAAGVVVTQPDGGLALDQQDARLTQLSFSNGMLWTGARERPRMRTGPRLTCALASHCSKTNRSRCS